MKPEQIAFLNTLGQPVARCTSDQVAIALNCQPHDVPVLVNAGLLKPLGKPIANSTKYYSTEEILGYAKDRKWLNKMTAVIGQHWRNKNQKIRDSKTAAKSTAAITDITPMREAS